MNRVVNIFFLSGFLSFSSLSWGADDYFTCNTSKGVLSLRNDAGQLIYKMEKNNNLFSYSSPAPDYKGFFYNHYSRFQTDYLNVSFVQNSFKYTIFSNYEDGNSTKGVSVVNLENNKEYIYDCKDEGVDRLSELVNKLQCDKDSALGCQ